MNTAAAYNGAVNASIRGASMLPERKRRNWSISRHQIEYQALTAALPLTSWFPLLNYVQWFTVMPALGLLNAESA
ncbi:MAG TPA: hypothetical protein VEC01_19670 [Noviherbaspirillum sp.]|uniref:hypothetical protein n=1 Tax=Noviherbaspirillum sp. TaxID=1926288 RepID=UPI002D35B539|nr:hypothetical protein [Noviherbaspirillum sp.]HYD97550.1 hypothetical protein [Noviherbaspirillum sp.]